MKTVGDYYNYFVSQLSGIYESNEAEQITILAFESILNFKRIDISINKSNLLESEAIKKFQIILEELLTGKPIQYVLGSAWFYGMNLVVNSNVLIPRRETEELVNWILKDTSKFNDRPKSIVDFCTGSGCIALALKNNLPTTSVVGVDVSTDALEIARLNSMKQNLEVDFLLMDVLNNHLKLTPHIVVSNPPYVLRSETKNLHRRVTEFEPSLALFVPDDDALIYYRHISEWALQSLVTGGRLFFEINEAKGDEITELLNRLGFVNVTLKKDLQGKDRMIRATKL